MSECCNNLPSKFDALITKLRNAVYRKARLNVTENGTYRAPEHTGYTVVDVDVPPIYVDPRTPEAITITENGVTDTPEDKVYTPITVNVPLRTPEAITITENGVTDTPEGKFYDPITVNVPLPTPEAVTITENGVTDVPDGKVYTPITVNVPQRTDEPITITENGVTDVPDGKVYTPITVDVPTPVPSVQGKTYSIRMSKNKKNYAASKIGTDDSMFSTPELYQGNRAPLMEDGAIVGLVYSVATLTGTQYPIWYVWNQLEAVLTFYQGSTPIYSTDFFVVPKPRNAATQYRALSGGKTAEWDVHSMKLSSIPNWASLYEQYKTMENVTIGISNMKVTANIVMESVLDEGAFAFLQIVGE